MRLRGRCGLGLLSLSAVVVGDGELALGQSECASRLSRTWVVRTHLAFRRHGFGWGVGAMAMMGVDAAEERAEDVSTG